MRYDRRSMSIMTVVTLLGALLSPEGAIWLAGHAAGRPDLIDDVTAICHRESRCTKVGVHERDAHLGVGWYGQVRLHERAKAKGKTRPGHIDPTCQPYEPGMWATHGIVGLAAGSHWKYLPECYEPEVLDNVFVSAVTAIEKYERTCWAQKSNKGWCHLRSKKVIYEKADGTEKTVWAKHPARKNNLKTKKHKPPKKVRPHTWEEWYDHAWRGVRSEIFTVEAQA